MYVYGACGRVAVVRVVASSTPYRRPSERERKQQAFTRLLEKAHCSASEIRQLQYLLAYLQQELSTADLHKFLAQPTPSETGCMRLPCCYVRASHFQLDDSEDPDSFLPIASELDEELPEREAVIKENASGHGIHLLRIPRRYAELPQNSLVETSDMTTAHFL